MVNIESDLGGIGFRRRQIMIIRKEEHVENALAEVSCYTQLDDLRRAGDITEVQYVEAMEEAGKRFARKEAASKALYHLRLQDLATLS